MSNNEVIEKGLLHDAEVEEVHLSKKGDGNVKLVVGYPDGSHGELTFSGVLISSVVGFARQNVILDLDTYTSSQISQTDFFSVLHFVHENDRQMYFDIFTQEQLQLFVLSSSTGVEATIIAYMLNYR